MEPSQGTLTLPEGLELVEPDNLEKEQKYTLASFDTSGKLLKVEKDREYISYPYRDAPLPHLSPTDRSHYALFYKFKYADNKSVYQKFHNGSGWKFYEPAAPVAEPMDVVSNEESEKKTSSGSRSKSRFKTRSKTRKTRNFGKKPRKSSKKRGGGGFFSKLRSSKVAPEPPSLRDINLDFPASFNEPPSLSGIKPDPASFNEPPSLSGIKPDLFTNANMERGAFLEKSTKANLKKSNDLIKAIDRSDLKIVKKLCANGANVNAAKPDGRTPLMLASGKGHLAIVRELCDHGANVNAARTTDGFTSLLWASANGHLEVVRELCVRGANVNAARTDGFTSLMFASEWGHLEVVRELCDRGADVNAATTTDGYTSLMWASEDGRLEIVRELCKRGVNVNAARIDGATALMLASKKGHLEIVKELYKKEANVNAATTDNGDTSLMLASRNDHLEVVKYLCDKEANVNAVTTDDGETSLMMASYFGNLEVVKELCKRGANVNVKDDSGITALMWASREGHLDVVRLLILQFGADVYAKDTRQRTAKNYAKTFRVNKDIIKLYDIIDALKDLGGVNELDKITGEELPDDVFSHIAEFLTGKKAKREDQQKLLIENLNKAGGARRTRTKSRGGYRKTKRVNRKKKLRMTRR